MPPVRMAGHANMDNPVIGSCETKVAMTQAKLGHVLVLEETRELLLHWLGQSEACSRSHALQVKD